MVASFDLNLVTYVSFSFKCIPCDFSWLFTEFVLLEARVSLDVEAFISSLVSLRLLFVYCVHKEH